MRDNYTTEERVALVTKLRERFLEQRERFEEYLVLLEQQESAIAEGDTEALGRYVEMESRIIEDIAAVQRVVTPLSEVYRSVTDEPDPEILELSESLTTLHREVSRRNLKNQELLRNGIDTLRQEIATLSRPQRTVNVYSNRGTGTLLDIST
ncbi:MAG: flagellar export chaperone FlgN [Spirochaetaceae bacterium]